MKYNITYFHIDTLIATAGTKGSIVDVNSIPEYLADDPIERIEKWLSWKKGGIALIDSSELNPAFNTIFNGFDDTVNGNGIAALQAYLQQIEYECSSVTGVYKESLNKIEQRDAVSNVKVGLKQSEIITKPLFNSIFNLASQMLLEMVNVCKISFKDGFSGSVILNDLVEVFNLEPENFCFTDHDIFIDNTENSVAKMQKIENYSIEMLKSGLVDPEVLIQGITAESLTEMKKNVLEAFSKKKKENDMLSQLQQQNNQLAKQSQELQSQLEQMSKQLENSTKEHENAMHDMKQKELDLKQQEIDNKNEIENRKLEIQSNQVKAEVVQLFDSNKNNNEVKNI